MKGKNVDEYLTMTKKVSPTIDKVIKDVLNERTRQNGLWGEQNHNPETWLMILGEEVGEANKAALETKFAEIYKKVPADYTQFREELIQVAAVAIAMVECIDRNKK